MARLARTAGLVFAFLIAASFVFIEVRHRVVYGHLVPLSLHADVTVANGDIGIPGITKLYDAHVTNFGILPRRVTRCEFMTDAFAHMTSIGYRLEQWHKSSQHWKTLLDVAAAYCRPYPLGMVQTQLTSKFLWPGQSLSTGEEATGARGNLKGETIRFVIVANGRDLPTSSFVIDEQVQGTSVGYRVRH